ncbi:MAG: translation initiation factor IF-5A [Candidatus Aenigmarchaeota archaeon]|nr:translation initiation factor IF-5A [Candidatus Aenigmarchaeota archaeon]MDW8149481.1 translation initiation factor IF-5A [Candidatus Aenigmarchaeota archaeon]
MTEKTKTEIKNLKPNSFVIIDGAPCRVEKVQISTSGKHGASKVRIEAIGLLDDRRRSIVAPSTEEVEVPIILKKNAQVLYIIENKAQLMDLQDFSTFELEIPEELKDKLEPGKEIQYFEVLGIKTLKQIK